MADEVGETSEKSDAHASDGTRGTAETATSAPERDSASPWLFLVGLLGFLGSIGLFILTVVQGIDILPAVVANALSALVLILWAALDTVSDPNSAVDSWGGAAGTALLLYGVYLFLSGAVIGLTGIVVHDRSGLGFWYIAVSLGAIFAGYLIFPTAAVLGDEDGQDDENDEDGQDDENDKDS